MVTVLRDQYVGEKPRSWPSALDGARRQGRLVKALAPGAREPGTHKALDDEPGRNVLQLLGDVLAQALQTPAAIGALFPGAEDRLFTGKVLGQCPAPRLGLANVWLRYRRRRPCNFLVLQSEFELVERFGAHPEALPAKPRELMAQLLDDEVAVAYVGLASGEIGFAGGNLCLRRTHHGVERGDIIG